jgi:hypothetical protein
MKARPGDLGGQRAILCRMAGDVEGLSLQVVGHHLRGEGQRPAAEGVTTAVVEAVHHFAREGLKPFECRPVETPALHHHAVKALATAIAGDDTPVPAVTRDPVDRRLQADGPLKSEGSGVGPEIVTELFETREHGQ